MIREGVTASPLYWPDGWERTPAADRRRSRFGGKVYAHSVYGATQFTLGELKRLGVPSWNVITSTNLPLNRDGMPYSGKRVPDDPGVAVWFSLHDEERVLACDRWDKVECNLHAIGLHVEALRGQERWGVGTLEQAFRGFAALPETAGGASCWDVLGLDREQASAESIEARFRELARKRHPDMGGNAADFSALVDARKAALEAIAR